MVLIFPVDAGGLVVCLSGEFLTWPNMGCVAMSVCGAATWGDRPAAKGSAHSNQNYLLKLFWQLLQTLESVI